MYVSSGQFYVFIASIAFGGMCGILFSISALFKIKLANVFLRIIPDLLAFSITACLYVLYSHSLNFPNVRVYMILGVMLGILIYFKSFHITLAKCTKKLYNLFKKKIKGRTKDGRSKG